ncbi:MAG: Gfo/Idh/MocA family oxidoreductase [Proteobacteria bacterium]|nr:Gfo/Idh/MocA family oxidoreductase [Pseudomonadota bacterium]MBI3496330.1 Gfo/Idh/MocA family oxidoreductase [Pseudomonadota bacterium]
MLGIGVVGAGIVGQVAHIANYRQFNDCQIVALADLRAELCRRVGERFGIPRLYRSHLELLQDPAVEAVVVVTNRPATGPVVLDALEASKQVFSEKPMAHTLAQATRLVEAAEARNLRYAVGFMKRHDAGLQTGKRLFDALLADGSLGKLVFARCYCFTGDFAANVDDYVMTAEQRPEGLKIWPIAPDWMPEAWVRPYAQFLNVFVHDVNTFRYVMGRTPELLDVRLGQPTGHIVTFDFGTCLGVMELGETSVPGWHEGLEIFFEKGRLLIEFAAPLLRNASAQVTLERAGGARETIMPAIDWSWAFRRQTEAFVKDVRTGSLPLGNGRDALEDLRLIEEIWRRHLAAEGKPTPSLPLAGVSAPDVSRLRSA